MTELALPARAYTEAMIGDGGHVCDGPHATGRVDLIRLPCRRLPGRRRLGLVGAAAAAGAAPGGFAPGTVTAAHVGQVRPSNGRHERGSRGVLDAVAAVAAADGDGDAQVLVILVACL